MVSQVKIQQTEQRIKALKEELAKKPTEKIGLDCIVVLSGLPVVSVDKKPQLEQKLLKIYSQFGKIDNLVVTVNEETSKLTGFAYLDFCDSIAAFSAVNQRGEYKLDQKHTITAVSCKFLSKLQGENEEIQDSQSSQIDITLFKSAREWKKNPKFNNLLSTCNFNHEFELFEHVDENSFEKCVGGMKFEQSDVPISVFWSPQGTFLLSVSKNKLEIYCTRGFSELEFELVNRIYLVGELFHVEFSPCDKYLIYHTTKDSFVETTLYSIIADIKIISFSNVMADIGQFDWSSCGKYFSFQRGANSLLIFESVSGNLVTGKPLNLPNLFKCRWSDSNIRNQSEPSIAVYCRPADMSLSSLTVYNIPSMTIVSSKTYANVSQCEIKWQPGHDCVDYISLISQHFAKTKTITVNEGPENAAYIGERYRNGIDDGTVTHSKLIGIDYILEVTKISGKKQAGATFQIEGIDDNGEFQGFFWEPMGGSHILVMFTTAFFLYVINKQTNRGKLVRKYTPFDMDINIFSTCAWNPLGRFFTLIDTKSSNGKLCFIDSSNGNILEQTSTKNFIHYYQWDEFGQYLFVANLSDFNHSNSSAIEYQDTKLCLFSISGRPICENKIGVIGSCQIRPRGKLPLSMKEIEFIKTDLKSYETQFSKDDKLKEQFDSQKALDELMHKLKHYFSWMDHVKSAPVWKNAEFLTENYEEEIEIIS